MDFMTIDITKSKYKIVPGKYMELLMMIMT